MSAMHSLASKPIRLSWGRAPILMLHEVLPDGTWPLPPYAITKSYLRRVLGDFASRGYTSGTLDDALYGPSPKQPAGTKRLVLTFDDGTRDFWDNARPILHELGWKATLFIVAGALGGQRAWEGYGSQPAPERASLLTGEQVVALHAEGFEIGSHSLSHRMLPPLADSELWEEVSTSREALESLVGGPVRWFAYPYLGSDARVESAVRQAGYEGACGGLNRKHSRYYLNRVEVSTFTLAQLNMRCNALFHTTRQALREVLHGV